jgi:hypothetical protein
MFGAAGPVALWIPGDPVPLEFIEAANNPDWIISAFNDAFERHVETHIMASRYGWPIVPLGQHRCTQAAALSLALPASLKAVAKALGIEQQKDEAGQRLMLQMMRPRKPKQGEDPTGTYWFDDLERRERLYAYCKQDVEAERAVHARVGHLPDAEQAVWYADAIINDRGIRIDRELARGAIKIGAAAQHAIDAELHAITAGAVKTVGQVARLLEWLAANGVELEDLQKETVRRALTQKDLPEAARRVLELRYSGARIAGAKFETMLNWAGADDRIRGAFKYHGAATGRWASYGVQLQNLKKANGLDIAEAVDLVTSGNFTALQQQYGGDPLGVVGELTRAAICAAPGHRLIIADFSGVESRVTAWLAGEQSKIGLWAKFDETGAAEDEPYYVLGKQFGFAEDCARAKGKTADLAFGYNGGEGAYRKFAGDEASTEEIDRLKRAWRDAHPNVVKLWGQLDRLAKRAVANPNQVKHVNRHVTFCFDGTFLRMRLPSGRCIAYPFPRLEKNERGDPVVIFKDNVAGKFADCRHGQGAWPGLWIENAVQAVARDLFVAAMQRLESAGYSITMHVHDEILAEVPDGFGRDEDFLHILTAAPAWATGLPIAAKVRNGPRFCEIKPQAANGVQPDDGDADDGRADGEASDDSEPDDDANGDDSSPASESPKSDNETSGSSGRRYQSGEREWGDNVAEYVYRDQRGRPYLKVKRTSNKQFPQFHHVDGKWIKGAPAGPKIPYRLPELLAAAPDTLVFICEGEKDADTVAALGLIATTNSEGAGKWTADLNRWFTSYRNVFVIEDNDQPGRDHARMVAWALRGIVDQIRVVSFRDLPPKGDVSDWLEQGHTKDELLKRCEATPLGGHALDVRNIGDLTVKPRPRGWLLGVSFCRRFFSQLQADGGVGKTALRYAQYLSLASGRSLTGEFVFVRCRVLILSLEDDVEELERRLWAAMLFHKLDPAELTGWLYYQALGRDAGKLKTLDEKGRVVDGELAASVEHTVVEYKIDLVGLDPFVKTHTVGENNNDAIDAVAQVLTDLAHKYDVAVDTPHHVAKGPADPGNAQKGRGASALVDAGRLVFTLAVMSSQEAEGFGIAEEDRRCFIRLDRGKVNIAPPARVAMWFELKSVPLGNSSNLYPHGDQVQTVAPWTPPDAWAHFDVGLQNAILDTIDAGLPNGRRYSDSPAAKDRAAWKVVQKHAPDKTPEQAREIIKAWVKNGVLRVDDYDDPERRTKVAGLFVNAERRPK